MILQYEPDQFISRTDISKISNFECLQKIKESDVMDWFIIYCEGYH